MINFDTEIIAILNICSIKLSKKNHFLVSTLLEQPIKGEPILYTNFITSNFKNFNDVSSLEVIKAALLCHTRPVPQVFSGAGRKISKS